MACMLVPSPSLHAPRASSALRIHLNSSNLLQRRGCQFPLNIILLHRVLLLYFLSMSTAAEGARDLRKTRLSLDERRISFGRHTKLSFGGRELAERTAGGRRFTEEERVAALEQLKIAHEKDVRNYRARLRKLEDHAHMYTEITQDKMHLLDRADQYMKHRQMSSLMVK
ncbi:unnamed protein product [Sphagnum jensenii]|uniref:Uncharacterized protein n=1 Tax=Sphagnum jensenii TaxID=128206 RepID=A0ABP1C319_9BRYO